jgi:fumarylacetoacetase
VLQNFTKMQDYPQTSWVEIPENSDFTLYNLPYGIFSTPDTSPRVGVAVGEYILDLQRLCDFDLFDDMEFDLHVFSKPTLNPLMALPKATLSQIRQRLLKILDAENKSVAYFSSSVLVAQSQAQMHLPFSIGDYTDFYSSLEHATNVGTMFRGKDNALMPNWKQMPIAYHGRSSSIRVSPHSFHRPMGQRLPAESDAPVFGPSVALDFELEVAFVIGKPSQMGSRVSTEEAENHIFGFVLFNDWSARDIQKWEYQPLGPFLGKNFASTLSAWVVPLEALEPFRVPAPQQDPVLPYLQQKNAQTFDIKLEVEIQTANGSVTKVCESNFKYLYWTVAQQIAHHTVGGCPLQTGDLCASGTISGPDKSSFGSLLELSWGGKEPLHLNDGTTRTYLQDHDCVIIKGFCGQANKRVGFGQAKATILPAKMS